MSNLAQYWSETYSFNITVTQAGAPLNITGKTLKFMAKHSYEDPDNKALITLSTGSGIVHTDAPNGLALATITPAMTAGLDPARIHELVQDIRLIDGSNAYTIEAGPYTISPVVVRAIT